MLRSAHAVVANPIPSAYAFNNMPMPYKKLVVESKKAIYFEIPKVACTTINYLLISRFIHDGKRTRVSDIHVDESLPRIWGKLDRTYAGYFKFAFVRDPVSRLRSCYRDKIRPVDYFVDGRYEEGLYLPLRKYGKAFWPQMSFEEFVESVSQIDDVAADPHFRSQWSFIADRKNRLQVDFIGRFESLDADLELVLDRMRATAGENPIPHLNRQAPEAAWQCSVKTLRQIEKRYQPDFEFLGYECGSTQARRAS